VKAAEAPRSIAITPPRAPPPRPVVEGTQAPRRREPPPTVRRDVEVGVRLGSDGRRGGAIRHPYPAVLGREDPLSLRRHLPRDLWSGRILRRFHLRRRLRGRLRPGHRRRGSLRRGYLRWGHLRSWYLGRGRLRRRLLRRGQNRQLRCGLLGRGSLRRRRLLRRRVRRAVPPGLALTERAWPRQHRRRCVGHERERNSRNVHGHACLIQA
jgi:hypothetical protein